MSFCYDKVGRKCSGRPQPGLVALQAAVQARWPTVGSFGIYNCRPSTSGKALSVHGEGRAWDAATVDRDLGDVIAARLIGLAEQIGLQRIIWWRREWDSRPGERHWEPYDGPDPHVDHLHIELCWAAAAGLTVETVAALLRDTVPVPIPTPNPPEDPMPSAAPTTVQEGDSGYLVAAAQGLLHAAGATDVGPIDGEFGPRTAAGLTAWQARAGLTSDGIVGPCTWQHLTTIDLAGC